MPQIRLLCSLAGLGDWLEDVDVDADTARSLIESGRAEPVEAVEIPAEKPTSRRSKRSAASDEEAAEADVESDD